jgi:hypothetical protein
MSDEELREFGKAARYMVSPRANMGKPPLPAFVLQLEEARAEWRRRHPEESAAKKQDSFDDSKNVVRKVDDRYDRQSRMDASRGGSRPRS